ncbi:phosphoesterase [Nostoc carneum NIES-2107]|nr:phosphoesterase [Nostoc carneum NIES-2107]
MSILIVNDLALKLVARDFSNGNQPTNGGPTKTSRALAIIHLAAHDAYAKVTGKFAPRLGTLPNPPEGIGSDETTGTIALLGAGITAAERLYPEDDSFIEAFMTAEAGKLIKGKDHKAFKYGEKVAEAWIKERKNDGSAKPQLDQQYDNAPGRHRRDPLDPQQQTLGRTWGSVQPFILKDVKADAPLEAPPKLDSKEYAAAFDEVINLGKNDIASRKPDLAAIGVFWGYDGANMLGTPPRLYNQIVREIPEFKSSFHPDQVRILTAINVAMADAGIAAWYWKYNYDFWRPVVGIREAEKGFGTTGIGDQNPHRTAKGDPFWLPLGAPRSNPFPAPVFGNKGSNFTPNFPAYPSGHATFGAACFETVASLLGKTPEQITVTVVSDEFNGDTTDNTGTTRPKWQQTFTLREAIQQNNYSRIYLGVHWSFDASGGESLGKAVANKVITAFK